MTTETCKCYIGPRTYRIPYPPPVNFYVPIIPHSFRVEEHCSLEHVPVEVETWVQSFEVIDGPTRDHIVYFRQI